MSSIRLSYRALQDGDVQHGLIVSDTAKLYGFARTNADMTALIALNRDGSPHTTTFNGVNAAPYNLPNGTVLRDVLNDMSYTVANDAVTVTVSANWGVVLLEEGEIDTPVAPSPSGSRSGSDVVLSWSPVVTDTEGGQELATVYRVYRSTLPVFVPSGSNQVGGDILPPPFGSSDGKISYTDAGAGGTDYYYIVRACNASGNCSDSAPLLVPSGANTATPTATQTNTATAVASSTATAVASATRTATSVPTACTIQFQDVPPSNEVSSFYPYVRCLACRGVLGGYPCGGTNPQTGQAEPCGATGNPYFRPGNFITRGQIAKIVSNAAGFDEAVEGQTYQDVPPSDEPSSFYVYVERLTAHNVMSGYPCGTRSDEPCGGQSRAYFRPGANATRAQLSKIVSNAAGFVNDVSGQTFADVPPPTPQNDPSSFYVFVERLAQRGVIGGYPCGGPGERCDSEDRPFFRPGNPVTRAQAAKIVANTFYPNCHTPGRP